MSPNFVGIRALRIVAAKPQTIRVILLVSAFALALWMRRWEQLARPQVWDEDGTRIVSDLINIGPWSLFEPLNGYLVLVPRLISFAALSISSLYYPLVSTVVAWMFIVAVAVAVAVSPLAVRGGSLLALAVFFIPTDSEVFGIPLYTLWWSGLLPVIAALWRPGAGRTGWRIAFVVAGGLSSPAILLAMPLFAYRAVTSRRDVAERVVCGVAGLCTLVQAAALLSAHTMADRSFLSFENIAMVVPKFLGNFALGTVARALPDYQATVLVAAGVLTLVLFGAVIVTERRHAAVLLPLAYLWFGSVALSAARVGIGVLDPVAAGPRYFFYPFVLESWFLIHLALTSKVVLLRAVASALVVLAALNALPIMRRSHTDLAWFANLNYCAAVPGTQTWSMPVQYDGLTASAWEVSLTGTQCRTLVARDALARLVPGLRPVLSPYVPRNVTPGGVPPASIAPSTSTVSNTWRGTDFQHSRFPGLTVIGSYRTSDADRGALALVLRRGDRVFYRSGPNPERQLVVVRGGQNVSIRAPLPAATDWALLEFSNPQLPDRFVAEFVDGGSGWGEWSAVALSAREP